MENFELEKLICKYAGMPVCTINGSGKVTAASSDIGEVFVYDKQEGADIFTIAGIKYSAILESADSGETLQLNRNDRIFRLVVRKLCDGTVSLDMEADAGGVDSFNVSVAAGILLYEIRRQRRAGQ